METASETPAPTLRREADVVIRGGPRYEFELKTPRAHTWFAEHAPNIAVVDGVACAGAMKALHMAMWMSLDGLWVL